MSTRVKAGLQGGLDGLQLDRQDDTGPATQRIAKPDIARFQRVPYTRFLGFLRLRHEGPCECVTLKRDGTRGGRRA